LTIPVSDHYQTMSLDEICAMGDDIKKISAKDCTLFLWITAPHLDKFVPVLEAWGFRFATCWVWDKGGYNYGHYASVNHELLIIGGKGRATPECDPKITASISSIQHIGKTAHSAKPIEYYDIIEQLYPNRKYLELFSRVSEKRKGWTHWGDEISG